MGLAASLQPEVHSDVDPQVLQIAGVRLFGLVNTFLADLNIRNFKLKRQVLGDTWAQLSAALETGDLEAASRAYQELQWKLVFLVKNPELASFVDQSRRKDQILEVIRMSLDQYVNHIPQETKQGYESATVDSLAQGVGSDVTAIVPDQS